MGLLHTYIKMNTASKKKIFVRHKHLAWKVFNYFVIAETDKQEANILELTLVNTVNTLSTFFLSIYVSLFTIHTNNLIKLLIYLCLMQ